tara:strand:- start:2900 stop:3298 length:399 start_codon:yes stop_codon:yes gene_type:complete
MIQEGYEGELRDVKLPPGKLCYSYTNGLYDCDKDTFYKYQDNIPADLVSAKFIPVPFSTVAEALPSFNDGGWDTDWESIPTPTLEAILQHQTDDPDVIKWFYIMLGRTLYKTKQYDDWQVLLYIMGLAGLKI